MATKQTRKQRKRAAWSQLRSARRKAQAEQDKQDERIMLEANGAGNHGEEE